ncbi:DUF3426 domain-containing protein [Herbaspirillum lusitanum]|uniref:DUF3426 domain-containing protein n=1 Tax=Herbaspirillum lusitanum TaxID=213312 RepID=A0ABW9A8E8_9BURK
MALATQCPHCFTSFRVASDQLKLRGGLVRCGNCKQVFNGNDYLIDPAVADAQVQAAPSSPAAPTPPKSEGKAVASAAPATPSPFSGLAFSERPAMPPPGQNFAPQPVPPSRIPLPAAGPGVANAPANAVPAQVTPNVFRSGASHEYLDAAAEAEASDAAAIPDLDSELTRGNQAFAYVSPQDPAFALPKTRSIDFNIPEHGANAGLAEAAGTMPVRTAIKDAGAESETWRDEASAGHGQNDSAGSMHAEEAIAATAIDAAQAHPEDDHEDAGHDDAHAPDQADEPDEPAFVKKAERREKLGRIARAVMIVLACVLAPALLLQATYYWRNQIAATVPALRPLLAAACAGLHCTVGLPTEVEKLSLESSELQLVPPNTNIYTLSVVLRNRGASAQAWPHIELTLNNDDEKAVVRRAFRPREYLSQAQIDNGIPGDSEQQLKLTFELSNAAPSGYRIYLFYP